jgi:tetratricopeptide (TPR) repeat protein
MYRTSDKKALGRLLCCFFIVLPATSVYSGNASASERPPDKKPSLSMDVPNEVAKEIRQAIKVLGYTDDIDLDLVQIVSSWKYMAWKQSLDQARQDYRHKKITADQLVQAEETTIKELHGAIRKEFRSAAADSGYFYLSKVIKDKAAQSMGYAQLFYVLGNTMGMTVRVVDVLQPAAGDLPEGEDHAACLAGLAGGRAMFVDMTQPTVSNPFVFAQQYAAVGNYWELKSKENPLKIPRRVQVLDRNQITAQLYYYLGNASAKANKDAEAISLYAKSLELDSKFAKAYCSRGAALFKGEGRSKAISDLTRATEFDPKCAEAYFNLGSMSLASGQYNQALFFLAKAIELKPTFSSAYKYRGIVLSRSGQTAEAMADYEKAMELNPKDPDTYILLGTLCIQSDQLDKAMSLFSKAVKIDPKNAEAYNNRGYLYAMHKKYTDAVADFMKALEINPKYADAYFNRGLVCSELEQNEKAISFFTEAIQLKPNYPEAYTSRGVIYFKLEQYPESIADFTRAIQRKPDYAEAYYNRGLAYASLQKKEEAISDLLTAAELNPALKARTNQKIKELKLNP